jgi:hypothetical protein
MQELMQSFVEDTLPLPNVEQGSLAGTIHVTAELEEQIDQGWRMGELEGKGRRIPG